MTLTIVGVVPAVVGPIFRADDQGLGSALAVLLFILVIPIVVYNIRQMRASEAR